MSQMETLTTEVEKGSRRTAVELGLVGPKDISEENENTNCSAEREIG